MLEKPNFFLVGQPKSGTTTLHYMLAQHPEIYMSPVKEPLFFSKDIIEQIDAFYKGKQFAPYRELTDYLSLFAAAKDEKILGESTTQYLYSKVAAQEIFKFNPQARILMILREPVSFLHSLHSQLLVEPAETVEDFETALSLESQRRAGKNLPPFTQWPGKFLYSERVKYYDQVSRYYDVFDKSQIQVIIYDDFKQDNAGVYRGVLEFLEVNTSFIPKLVQANVSKRPRSIKLSLWVTHYSLTKKAIKLLSTRRFYQRIKGIVKDNILLKKEPRRPLDPALRTKLMVKYKPEVVKISKFLGIDLVKKWGYDQIA